jgi:hypothetical protein
MTFQNVSTIFRVVAGAASAFALSSTAFATTCTSGDWVPGFCDLPVASATRCALGATNWVARAACEAATVGCAEIGGCFGTTPVGHWWPINEDGIDKRCQCGCFAEETEFSAIGGSLTGTEIIAEASRGGARLLSLDSLSSRSPIVCTVDAAIPVTKDGVDGVFEVSQSDVVIFPDSAFPAKRLSYRIDNSRLPADRNVQVGAEVKLPGAAICNGWTLGKRLPRKTCIALNPTHDQLCVMARAAGRDYYPVVQGRDAHIGDCGC